MSDDDRKVARRLAAEADVDNRTAERAMRDGLSAIKGAAVRERIATAAKKLKAKLKD